MAVRIITSATCPPFLPKLEHNSLTDSVPQNAVGLFFVYSGTFFFTVVAMYTPNANPKQKIALNDYFSSEPTE